ncbi:DUF3237 domain-containing protein [uncultured Microbacterium sp.]|uniref:DUF3237 domain-containing protein n=1 Tax=uncultured Microbacterium sp. TaxID=191216 RepID=UPI0028D8E81A|nr:DUF3237 domain-containing protein [uncultured Microbacterium sp.]
MTEPPAPQLRFLATIEVDVGAVHTIGATDGGVRRVVPILGGSVSGPELNGSVLPMGEDFQVLRSETVSELHARYVIRTDRDELITVDNHALRAADPDVLARLNRGEQVDPADVYFRCVPRMQGSGRWSWLSERVLIGTGERRPQTVIIRVYVVD